MKTKTLFTPLVISGLFTLVEIQGQVAPVPGTDFKEFEEFTLCISTPIEDAEYTLVTFSREKYDCDSWKTNFKVDQLTEGLPGTDELKAAILENAEHIEAVINEFIDEYEGQDMD